MHCTRCRLKRCVCAVIPRVETRTRIVIVRHAAERAKMSNTAHFARMALPACELLEYGVADAPFDESALPADEGTYVLYPDENARPAAEVRPQRLVVLDGSWSQARRMRQRILALRGLPFVALPPPDRARERLRRQRHAHGMSTLEAIARAIAIFEGDERAAPLDHLHDAVVRACLALSG
jgi:DTW domain-containing protein YfiP